MLPFQATLVVGYGAGEAITQVKVQVLEGSMVRPVPKAGVQLEVETGIWNSPF